MIPEVSLSVMVTVSGVTSKPVTVPSTITVSSSSSMSSSAGVSVSIAVPTVSPARIVSVAVPAT